MIKDEIIRYYYQSGSKIKDWCELDIILKQQISKILLSTKNKILQMSSLEEENQQQET